MSILKIGLEKGREEGREEGLEFGIKSMIVMCQECGGTRDIAIQKVQEMYALSEEEAIVKVNLYWEN